MKAILVVVSLAVALAVAPVFTMDAGAAGKCPDKSSVKKLVSEEKSIKEASPNIAAMKTGKALMKDGGKRLSVYIGNLTFTPKVVDAGMVNPVTKKGEAILQINFANGNSKVAAGEYKAANPYGKAFATGASVHVKGMNTEIVVSGSSRSKGTATIIEITDKKVCGTFDLVGELGSASGEFVADIDK